MENFLASFGKFLEKHPLSVLTEELGEWEIPDILSDTLTHTNTENSNSHLRGDADELGLQIRLSD